ncbi:MAG: MinD/ParA family protein [Pirellula sp.]
MAKIISTHSFRAGTGKSHTIANLAVLTAKAGYRVGVVDAAIQSSGIHTLFKLSECDVTRSLHDYLLESCCAEDAAYDVTERCIGDEVHCTERTRLFLIPSSIRRGDIANALREGYEVSRLNDCVRSLVQLLRLDYLFIDTEPGVNEETLLSMAISDALILMLRPDQQEFQGTAIAIELARRLNIPKLHLIINKAPSGMDPTVLRMQVECMYGLEVQAVLPLSVDMAKKSTGDIFCNRYPTNPLTQELQKLGDRIVGGLPSSRLA